MMHKGTIEIQTDRLTLRRFTLDDAQLIYQNWAKDPDVTKFLTWPPHENIDITKSILTDWIKNYENLNFYQWAIVPKNLDEPIGSISVVHSNDKIEMVHLGYCIGKQWWKKEYTSEALLALLKFFFEEIKVNRIEARFDVRNLNSGKVMEKCGLKYEGTKYQADWNNQGICDIKDYSILAEDYLVQQL